ncbi:MAG: hypothetical protein KDI30_08120 [Pseudomonadales bacterium]|nr:hypothetical protein [Pseudomonadales bacterium]
MRLILCAFVGIIIIFAAILLWRRSINRKHAAFRLRMSMAEDIDTLKNPAKSKE